MARILITGASGFVGRAVCKSLRVAGYSLSGTTSKIEQKRGPENIPLYYIPEIGPDTDWSGPVAGADVIIHLAARVHVTRDTSSDPLAEHRRVNRDGTRQLAIAAAAAGVNRLVFISTIKVNGEITTGHPFSEEDTPLPGDPYGISKWEAEQTLLEVSKNTGLEVVILRVPLVYGPYVKGNFLRLIEACSRLRIMPFGAITNQRSLIYVGNLASAIKASLDHSAAVGKTYLVRDGQDMSTPDLVYRISGSLGSKVWLISLPRWLLTGIGVVTGGTGAIARLTGSLQVDSSLIEKDLEWSPPYTIQEGLNETARWYLSSRI